MHGQEPVGPATAAPTAMAEALLTSRSLLPVGENDDDDNDDDGESEAAVAVETNDSTASDAANPLAQDADMLSLLQARPTPQPAHLSPSSLCFGEASSPHCDWVRPQGLMLMKATRQREAQGEAPLEELADAFDLGKMAASFQAIRSNSNGLPDTQRRERAALLAMALADAMFEGDDSDGENDDPTTEAW